MRVVLCNAPRDHAERIARALVEAKLAACVNVVPGIVSIYRWKGTIEREEESTLLIKTSDDRVPALMDEIRKQHPYEVPEIVALAAAEVSPAYAAWVEKETR
ncbi:MAG: divalent-cation tolerance protein CutA [Polyangiales bacterium]